MTSHPVLIGVTGFKRSGKNTAGDILASLLPGESEMISFAEPLKKYTYDHNQMVGWDQIRQRPYLLQEAVDKYGWEEAKDLFSEVRRALQFMGTEVFRNNVSLTYWTDLADQAIAGARSQGKHAIITDVRFPNEGDFIRERGGLSFRVMRPEVEPDPTQPLHSSEAAILQIPVDAEIDNSGTLEELRAATKTALFKVLYGG